MLDYENQVFLDVIHSNELFIFAKGILTEQIMKNVFKAYTTETSLVFVLNASPGEEKYFREHLKNEKIYSITSEISVADRKDMYNNGGVFFVTSRILVVDLLKDSFPIDKVTGILVLRAHNVVENSQEAFILRLYRQKNKEGFIKGMSDSPASFLIGFSRLARVMRSCFLANVSLWPRFHALVKESLQVPDEQADNVIEIQLNLTEEMKEIQSNFIDLVGWSVSELKRLVPALNYEEISAETALTSGFQKIVGAHMDAEWNTVSPKAKELLNDIKVFRLLLTHLTKYDCVSFHSSLSNYTSQEMVAKASWILSPAGEKIIVASRNRIYKQQQQSNSNKKAKLAPEIEGNEEEDNSQGSNKNNSGGSSKTKKTVFKPEVPPKWLALSEILNDVFIKNSKKKSKVTSKKGKKDEEEIISSSSDSEETTPPNSSSSPDSKTLIFVEDMKTCSVLKNYLTFGSVETLGMIVQNSENVNIELPEALQAKIRKIKKNDNLASSAGSSSTSSSNSNSSGTSNKNSKPEGNKKNGQNSTNKKTNVINDDDNDGSENSGSKGESDKDKGMQITLTQITRKYEEVHVFPSPVFIRPFRNYNEDEAFSVNETLCLFKPDIIVIFDPQLELVRQIEQHRARMAPQQNIRVYFLTYRNSVEEQIYLTFIQREKLAFEKLIEEKASMVVPNEREGRDELNQDLWRDPSRASDAVASTSAQSKRNMEAPVEGRDIIIVDIREFRSELPSLLHKRGMDLEPLQIDVGDYILTPEICVERKSISDLIGSLNTGRMYKQAEAMGRHYKKPILLIEHEQKALLPSKYSYRSDLSQAMPKLQALTMNFPNLRLIWSPSAHYTSEIFQELKKGKEQPSAEQALSIQKESIGAHITTKYNPVTHSFLSKMPGIDSRNVYKILNRCENLQEVADLSLKELEEILESYQNATLLHAAIHSENLTVPDESGPSHKLKAAKAAVGSKRNFFRKPAGNK